MHRFLLMIALCSAALRAQNEFPKPEGIAPAKGYSHVVVAQPGRLVIISGQVGLDASGTMVGRDDLRAQTEQVFVNLKLALEAAGATFNDVVKINWFVRGLKPEFLPVIRAVRDKYVNTAHPPASTLVGVTALFRDDCLIEVEATAVLPDKKPAQN